MPAQTTPSWDSRSRLNAQERPVVLVRQQVEESVGPFAHFPDTLPELRQHRLAPQLLCAVVEHNALQVACARYSALAQGSYEHVASPRRKLVAGVDGHAGDRDRGQPHHER